MKTKRFTRFCAALLFMVMFWGICSTTVYAMEDAAQPTKMAANAASQQPDGFKKPLQVVNGLITYDDVGPQATGHISWTRLESIPRQSPGATMPFKETPTDTRDYIHEPMYVDRSVYTGMISYVDYVTVTGPAGSVPFTNQGSVAANLAYLNEPFADGIRMDNIVTFSGLSAEQVIYAVTYMNNGTYWMYRAYVDGELAWCIEPTMPSNSGEIHDEVDANLVLSARQQEVIALIMHYANQMGAATNDAIYCAAQMMIWEINNRTLRYTDLSNNGIHPNIYYGGVVGRWESEYAAIKAAVLEHYIIPSFLAPSSSSPFIDLKSYVVPNTLTDGILEGGSIILEDIYGVVDKMNWPSDDPNFIFEVIDNYHLKITSRGNIVRDWHSPGVITKQGFEGIMQMGTLVVGDGKGNSQDLARTKVLYDPFGGYMRLRTNGDNSGFEVAKTDKENEFVVHGNTGAEVELTHPDGTKEITNLPLVITTPGTYSIREIHTPLFDNEHLGYVLDGNTYTFTVASDESWDEQGGGRFSLANKRQKGQIIVQKVDEDDHYINHTNVYADENTFTESPDANSLFTCKPEILEPKPQGDATFEGAEFTISVYETIYLANGDIAKGTDENGTLVELRQGVIVDRITTDAKGRAVSRNDLELGLYAVQETVLPEGYQHRGYEAEGQIIVVNNHYTDENTPINVISINYSNSVIKGHLSGHKVLEGEVDNDITSGGTSPLKTPVEGVYFAVYLKSKQAANSGGVVVIGSDGVPRTVTDKTKLPDDFYIVMPLDGNAPPMIKDDDTGKWYWVNEDGTRSESGINPTDLFDTEESTEDGYYKSLYMILVTDDQGNFSTRNPESIAWVSEDGVHNIAPVSEPMPLPYGAYTAIELNAPEGYEAVWFEFEIGYESFLNNPDDKGTIMTPDTGYTNTGDVVQNGKFGKDHYFSIENKVIKQRLIAYKRDNETGKLIPQANIPFKIWWWYNTTGTYAGTHDDANIGNTDWGEWVTQTSYYPTPTTTDVFATNVEGWFALEEPLVYGDYELVELSAPTGYWLPNEGNTDHEDVPLDENGNPQPWLWSTDPDTGETIWYVDEYGNTYRPYANVTPFSILGTGDIHDLTKPIPEITVHIDVLNENQKGYLTLYKEGWRLVGNKTINGKFGTETQPVWELGGLPGAEYQIYAETDIITPDGTTRHVANELIQTCTTDSRGWLVSEPMYLGAYYVIESRSPFGYLNTDGTKYELLLTYQGQNVRIFPVHQEHFNVRQNVEFLVSKERENAGAGAGGTNTGNSTWTPANGITFGLYAREDIFAVDGSVALPADALLETIVIGNGKGASSLDLPIGKYYAKELETNEDLVLSDTEYDIEFKFHADDVVYDDEGHYVGLPGAGVGETVIEIKLNNGVSIKNYLKRGSLEVVKVDQDFPSGANAVYLGGAEFTLFNALGEAVALLVTDQNGYGRVDGIPYGVHTLKETKAPDGYKLSSTVWTVNITADGQVIEYTIENEIDMPVARVQKVSASGYPLAGATFEILKCQNEDEYLAYKAAMLDYLALYEVYLSDLAEYQTALENGTQGPVEPVLPQRPADVMPEWKIYTGINGAREYRYVTDGLGGFTSGNLEDGYYLMRETKNPAGYTGSFSQEFAIEAEAMARPRIVSFTVTNYREEPGVRYGHADFKYGGRRLKGFPQTGGSIEITHTDDVVDEVITRGQELLTDGEQPTSHDFPQTITQNGKRYKLQSVTYELTEFPHTEQVDYDSLPGKSVPETYTIERDGVTYELHLVDVTYTEVGGPFTVDYEDDYGYALYEPKAPQTKTITVTDEETGEEREVEVQLVSIEQVEDFAWRPITIQGYFYGDAGIAGFSFGGTIIPYDPASPVWQGYEDTILDYLDLDSDYYRIVGAKWKDGDFIIDADGNSVRRATIYAEQYAARWVANYSTEAEGSVEYSATATYAMAADGQHHYTATATYVLDEGLTTAQIIFFIGIFVLLIALVIVLIIIGKKRRRRKDEDDY